MVEQRQLVCAIQERFERSKIKTILYQSSRSNQNYRSLSNMKYLVKEKAVFQWKIEFTWLQTVFLLLSNFNLHSIKKLHFSVFVCPNKKTKVKLILYTHSYWAKFMDSFELLQVSRSRSHFDLKQLLFLLMAKELHRYFGKWFRPI